MPNMENFNLYKKLEETNMSLKGANKLINLGESVYLTETNYSISFRGLSQKSRSNAIIDK